MNLCIEIGQGHSLSNGNSNGHSDSIGIGHLYVVFSNSMFIHFNTLESGIALASLFSLPLGLENMAIHILPHASSGAMICTTYGE